MRFRSRSFFNLFTLMALLISLLGGAVTFTPAKAASIVVNSTADDTLANLASNSTCDLREAIESARLNTVIGQCTAGSVGGDTITFSDALGTATIVTVSTFLGIPSDGLTIDGGSDITISGNNSHRIFVNFGTLTLENITLTRGLSTAGGAIYNVNTLVINNSTFSENTASGSAASDGGAIRNDGLLTVTNSTFINNTAQRDGGAILNNDNLSSGGGIIRITGTTFTTNSTVERGGAVASYYEIEITKSIFSGNRASNSGGAIYTEISIATIIDSTFTNNYAFVNGGAIFKDLSSSLSVTGSTFSGNHADLAGGGIYANGETFNITNSTLYNNYTSFAGVGGSFYNNTATLNIRNVTISHSDADSGGGGIFNNGGTVNLYNSIIANTTGGGDCSNSTGTVNAGHNLLEDVANNCLISNGTNNNIVGVDPKLSALANNGGPTQTMELDLTSDAIDKGNDTICNSAPVSGKDQRGITRPQGSACDIGAFEVDGPPDVTVNQASGQADPTNTSPIKFTVTFDEPIDTATFTDADLAYTGSTAPGTFSALITEVAPNNGTTFEVEISGMTGSGDVVLFIEAGKVQDLGGNDNNASTSIDNTVTYEVDAPIVISTTLQTAYTNTGPNTFTVTFSEEVNNTGGGVDPDDATNVNNYMVVEDGLDGIFQTADCLTGLAGDDTQALVTSVSLFNPPPTAAVTLSAPLGVGNYRLFVCGTTSIVDLAGNPLNGGADFTFDFTVSATTGTPGGTGGTAGSGNTITASALPKTGFAPKQVTTLPPQSADHTYANLGELWLEIPSLSVKTTIVGVPRTGDEWELSWLGNDTGWLNGTAFPTWNGNSVLTAHVINASGLPGPFAELNKLKYGDQVIIHMGGAKYIYEIRTSKLARPYSTSYAFESMQEHSYLTLITCQFYNPLNDSYLFRRVVRAVLVSVEGK